MLVSVAEGSQQQAWFSEKSPSKNVFLKRAKDCCIPGINSLVKFSQKDNEMF